MKILYFAWLREKVGVAQEELTVPAQARTVGDLALWLGQRSAGHAAAFANAKLVRCAINQEFAGVETPIAGAAEIAFFPPVTGG